MRDEGDDGGYVLPGREPFAAFAATRSGRDTRRLVTELMHPRSPHRGLLLFHAVGTGKTCVAIAALHAWLRTGREVLVLTPAGLRANFLREMTGNVCGVFRSPSGEKPWAVAEDREALLPGVREVAEDLRLAFPAVLPPSVLARDRRGREARPTDADRAVAARLVTQSLELHVRFVAYNGLTDASRRRLADPSALAGRLVIVDEAHGFPARAGELLRALMDAPRCRVLLMTATPIANAVHDAVPLLNLCRGWVTTLRVRLPADRDRTVRADAALRAVPELWRVVDEVAVSADAVELTVLPEGFEYADVDRVRVVPVPPSAPFATAAARHQAVARTLGARPADLAVRQRTLFPEDPEDFAREYLDAGEDAVRPKKRAPFLRRIAGLVSFQPQNTDGFPRVYDPKVVAVPLGPALARRYADERRAEVLAERRARNVRLYYAYTRAIANFAWPSEYRRRRHAGDDGADEVDAGGLLERLAADAARTISPAAIADHSPKMAAVVARLQAAPDERHLVFSNFRQLEGVRTLALVLRAHGWTQLHPGDRTSPPLGDAKSNGRAFLDLAEFGGDAELANSGAVQVALISRSSAEGLSLRGYTQVHLLEPPFTWNILEQVRGRAARRTSHRDLPARLRHVRTFVYVATLGAGAEETSDQKIVQLMMRKELRARELYELLRAGAVNCAWESPEGAACGVAPEDEGAGDRLWSALSEG